MSKRDGIENGRLFVIEPNPIGNEIRPNEDLNIIVELETSSKSRSALVARSSGKGEVSNSQKDGSRIIKFIGGSKTNVDDEGKGVYNLTTNYTEGNGTFDKMDPDRDKESLGIENIEISFGTDYAPNIKIKFIDVRGNAILTQGNESKYSVFFELPYPIFSLTIKGFYGKPVTYCLHLMKWNAAFNSETGNFEINAEFIGYTYALLTDGLLGLIRAVIRTPEGKPFWDAAVSEYAREGITLKSIDDFIKDLQNLGDEFEKLTQNDSDVKALNISKESRQIHEVVEGYFTELMNSIVGDGDEYFNNGGGVLAVPLTRLKDDSIQNDINKFISKIEKEIEGEGGLNNKITNPDMKFKSDDLKNYTQLNPIKISELTNEESVQKIIIENNSNDYTFNNDDDPNIDLHKKALPLAREILRRRPTGNGDTEITVFDFRTPLNELGRVLDKIKENDKIVRQEIAKKLEQVSKQELGFNPTVKNIFRMFCVHFEVLLETIYNVSNLAEKNDSRKVALNNAVGEFDTKNSKEIWPWPEFRKENVDDNNESFLEESWLGSEVSRGAVNEVEFIENLLKELLELARNDNKLLDEKEGVKGPQFYPVSPLDTYLANPLSMTLNPYDVALNGENSRNTPQEITRCLLMRGFLGLGASIRNGVRLNQDTIKIMGSLEAENVFSVLLDMTNKPKVRDLIKSINEYSEKSPSEGADKLISEWLVGYDEKDISNPQGKKKSLLAENGINYIYNYIFDPSDTLKKILPISGNFDGKIFHDNDGNFLESEIINDVVSDTTHFITSANNSYNNFPFLKKYIDNRVNSDRSEPTNPFSPYFNYLDEVNSTNLNFYSDNDYGDTFFKIIDKTNYESTFVNPDFGGEIYKIYEESSLNQYISADSLRKTTYNQNSEYIEGIKPYVFNTKSLTISDITFLNKSGDKEKDGIHFKKKGLPDGTSNVLCAYWLQNTDIDDDENGGTFLSLGFVDDNFKDKINIKRRWQFEKDAPNDDAFIVIDSNKINDRNSKELVPRDFGKQRELIGHLLGETEDSSTFKNLTYTPFIDFGIAGIPDEDETNYYFSLFGSRFYYEQETVQARAFLFLHCFAWNGFIGDHLDQFNSDDSTDVSLFDIFEWDDNTSFYTEDDTPTLKGLYQNHASFIKAPKLWIYFIGGLLYRLKYPFDTGKSLIKFDNGSAGTDFLPWCDYSEIHSGVSADARSYVPNELRLLYDKRAQANFGMNFVFDAKEPDRDDEPKKELYTYIEKSILGLPKQVKEAFIDKFLHFSTSEFEGIRKEFEIQYSERNGNNVTFDFTAWKTMWNGYYSRYGKQVDKWSKINPEGKETDEIVENVYVQSSVTVSDVKTFFSEKVIENYSNISAVNDEPWKFKWKSNLDSSGVPRAYQINLVIRRGSPGSNKLNDLISGYEYIMNGNPKTFQYQVDDTNLEYLNFVVNKNDYKLYLENFFSRFSTLTADWQKKKEDEEDKLEQQIFNSTNDDKIKLQLYRTISAIYNKWVANSGGNVIHQCSINGLDKKIAVNERGNNAKPRLIDSFRFVDRAHLDIGDKFYINPFAVQDLIIGNYNTSFYDFIDSILNANNFNFIPLPTFINYSNVGEVADVFKPYTYKEYEYGEVISGPSFVCCYAGQGSQHLNLGENATYEDDGVVVDIDSDGNIVGDGLPKDFKTDKRKDSSGNTIEDGTLNIPFFMVSYGIQNQSYFKSVKIDQSEFSETDESLQIIEDISQTGDKRQPVYNGQNLFNVYSRRGYNVNVEMMGDAMIQPMMYFQLDDIPMFRGAYQIYKVSHSITPHNMVTRFTGNRIKRTRTPLITAQELFMNLLGGLESLNEATGDDNSNNLDTTEITFSNNEGIII